MHRLLVGIIALMAAISFGGVFATTVPAGSTGCTESMTISPPTTQPATLGWVLNGEGELKAIDVTWMPERSADYHLVVTMQGGSGATFIAGSGILARTDTVLISPSVGAENIDSIALAIVEEVLSPTNTLVTVGWRLDSAGQAAAAEVRWTPNVDGSYTLEVVLGNSRGSRMITSSGTIERIDTIFLLPAAQPGTADSATLCIDAG